jgi:hypothetical protein
LSSSPDREVELNPLKGVPNFSDIFAPKDGPSFMLFLIVILALITGNIKLQSKLNRKALGSIVDEFLYFQLTVVKPPHR